MHKKRLEQWQHSHDFLVDRTHAEKSIITVMWLTAVTMVAEIIAGSFFGSMALLADGWHMATHVAAFGIAVFAYRYARLHADPFGICAATIALVTHYPRSPKYYKNLLASIPSLAHVLVEVNSFDDESSED